MLSSNTDYERNIYFELLIINKKLYNFMFDFLISLYLRCETSPNIKGKFQQIRDLIYIYIYKSQTKKISIGH